MSDEYTIPRPLSDEWANEPTCPYAKQEDEKFGGFVRCTHPEAEYPKTGCARIYYMRSWMLCSRYREWRKQQEMEGK